MKKAFFLLILVYAGLALSVISCKSDNSAFIIGLNQNIHHDDFEYSVTAFSKTPEIIGERDTIYAMGIYYIVHFKTENKALRVDHNWSNSIAYIIDEKGNIFDNIEENQYVINKSKPFGLKESYITRHGESDTTLLVFDIPADVREPYLMIRGGTLMGDIFDSGRFRKMKIKLF